MSLFEPLNAEQTAQLFAQYFPQGKAWNAKNIPSKNLYKLLKGCASEDVNFRNKLNEQLDQYSIFTTTEYLEEYETMLGIPDDCFTNQEDVPTRRNQIIAKMLAYGTQTAQNIIDLVAILGFEITITNGFGDAFPVTFPWAFMGSSVEGSNTIIVTFLNIPAQNTFPVPFPWAFGGFSYINRVECFIIKLIPSTDNVIFKTEV